MSFEPSDIISRVMSFGAPTPIEVAVSGPNFDNDRQFAQKIRTELAKVPSLRDLQYEQELEYPAIKVDIDRAMAGALNVSADQVARSLTEATSSSRFTANAKFLGRPQVRRGIPDPGASIPIAKK